MEEGAGGNAAKRFLQVWNHLQDTQQQQLQQQQSRLQDSLQLHLQLVLSLSTTWLPAVVVCWCCCVQEWQT
jgi:hypothetical protein